MALCCSTPWHSLNIQAHTHARTHARITLSRRVTEAEAAAWEEALPEREARAAQLREHALQEFRRRGITPPDVLMRGGQGLDESSSVR